MMVNLLISITLMLLLFTQLCHQRACQKKVNVRNQQIRSISKVCTKENDNIRVNLQEFSRISSFLEDGEYKIRRDNTVYEIKLEGKDPWNKEQFKKIEDALYRYKRCNLEENRGNEYCTSPNGYCKDKNGGDSDLNVIFKEDKTRSKMHVLCLSRKRRMVQITNHTIVCPKGFGTWICYGQNKITQAPPTTTSTKYMVNFKANFIVQNENKQLPCPSGFKCLGMKKIRETIKKTVRIYHHYSTVNLQSRREAISYEDLFKKQLNIIIKSLSEIATSPIM